MNAVSLIKKMINYTEKHVFKQQHQGYATNRVKAESFETQVFAPSGSCHAVLHCCLHVLSHGCALLVVTPAPCVVVPTCWRTRMGGSRGCHVVPRGLSLGTVLCCGGSPGICSRGTSLVLPPQIGLCTGGGESPASRQRDAYERAAPQES